MASSSNASAASNDIRRSQLPSSTPYDGDFPSQRDELLKDTADAADDAHVHYDARTNVPQQAQQERAQMSSNVYISGQARVHLGDNYAANRHLFEIGTEEEKRAGELCQLYAGFVATYF